MTLVPESPSVTADSHLAITRRSLAFMNILLLALFLGACLALIQIALHLNHEAAEKSVFYANKAMTDQEQAMRVVISDYAFWGDAYKHLHVNVDHDWAYVSKNMGPSLFEDFGLEGLFVVNANDVTSYAVIDGKLKQTAAHIWLGAHLAPLIARARATAADETPTVGFMHIKGMPALVGAAALTNDSDPAVPQIPGPESVLLFIDLLQPEQVAAIGRGFGLSNMRIETGLVDEGWVLQLPIINGPALLVRWDLPKPGKQLLYFVLPLLALACAMFALVAWLNLRNAYKAARAIDASYREAQRYQAQISHQANHDSLTGLANRALLSRDLHMACQTATRDRRSLALLLVDLDNFKPINDLYSHSVGDQVLIEVAARMMATTRPAETVARLGGDEFVILLPELGNNDEPAALATRIIEILARPYQVDDLELHISASIGIVVSGGHISDPIQLIHHADLAMYKAKSLGRNRYYAYGPELSNAKGSGSPES